MPHGGPHALQNEFINRRTGEIVSTGTAYHIHPDKGPMEGVVHNPNIQGGLSGHDFFDRITNGRNNMANQNQTQQGGGNGMTSRTNIGQNVDNGPSVGDVATGTVRGNSVAEYRIHGTNEPYIGRVVEIGGNVYSTQGGAREGDSLQLVAATGNNNNPGGNVGGETGTTPRNAIRRTAGNMQNQGGGSGGSSY